MTGPLLCSPAVIDDPAIRERVVDLAERLRPPGGSSGGLDALTDRRAACSAVRDLEDRSAKLLLVPALLEVFRKEANRSVEDRAGAMLQRPLSRALRSEIWHALDPLWGVSVVHAYEDAGEPLESLLSPLVDVLHLDERPRASGGCILLLGKLAKWRPGAVAETVVAAGDLDEFASIVGAWLEGVDRRPATHGTRLLAAVATRFPDRVPASSESLRAGLESTLRTDSVTVRSHTLLACRALGVEVERRDGELQAAPRAYLRARLEDADGEARATLVERLGSLVVTDSNHDALVEPLVRCARNLDNFERDGVLRAVSELVASDVESPREAIRTLSKRVRNSSEYDQSRFARSLGEVAITYPEAVTEPVRSLAVVVDRLESGDGPLSNRAGVEFLGKVVVAGDESTSCVFRALRREFEVDFGSIGFVTSESMLPTAGALGLEAPELAPDSLRPLLERARGLGDATADEFLAAVGEVVLRYACDREDVVATLRERVQASDGSRRARHAWLFGAFVTGAAVSERFERSANVARTVVTDALDTDRALELAGELAALHPESVANATDALTAHILDAERGSKHRDRAAHAVGELSASASAVDPTLDVLAEHVRTTSGDERTAYAIALGETTAANRTTPTGGLRTLVARLRAASLSEDLDFGPPLRTLSEAAATPDVPLAQTHAPLVEWARDDGSSNQAADQDTDAAIIVTDSETTADTPTTSRDDDTTIHPRRDIETPAELLGEAVLATQSVVPDPIASAAHAIRESKSPSKEDRQTLGLLVAAETPVARTLGQELLTDSEHTAGSISDSALASIGDTIVSTPTDIAHTPQEECTGAGSTSGLDRWLAVGGLASRSLQNRHRTQATLELLADRVELTEGGFTGPARALGELLVAAPRLSSDSVAPLVEYHRDRTWRVISQLESEYLSLETIGLLKAVDPVEFARAVITQVLSGEGDLRRYVRQVVRATEHDVVSPAELAHHFERVLAAMPAGPPEFFSAYRSHEHESGLTPMCADCGSREYADAFFDLIAVTAEHIPPSSEFHTLGEQLQSLLREETSTTERDRLTITETLAQLDGTAVHTSDGTQ